MTAYILELGWGGEWGEAEVNNDEQNVGHKSYVEVEEKKDSVFLCTYKQR